MPPAARTSSATGEDEQEGAPRLGSALACNVNAPIRSLVQQARQFRRSRDRACGRRAVDQQMSGNDVRVTSPAVAVTREPRRRAGRATGGSPDASAGYSETARAAALHRAREVGEPRSPIGVASVAQAVSVGSGRFSHWSRSITSQDNCQRIDPPRIRIDRLRRPRAGTRRARRAPTCWPGTALRAARPAASNRIFTCGRNGSSGCSRGNHADLVGVEPHERADREQPHQVHEPAQQHLVERRVALLAHDGADARRSPALRDRGGCCAARRRRRRC